MLGLEERIPHVSAERHADVVTAHDHVDVVTAAEVILQGFGAGARLGDRDRSHVFPRGKVGRHVPRKEVHERLLLGERDVLGT